MSLHDDLLARREDYPVLARSTYLASHTLGACMGRRASVSHGWRPWCARRSRSGTSSDVGSRSTA